MFAIIGAKLISWRLHYAQSMTSHDNWVRFSSQLPWNKVASNCINVCQPSLKRTRRSLGLVVVPRISNWIPNFNFRWRVRWYLPEIRDRWHGPVKPFFEVFSPSVCVMHTLSIPITYRFTDQTSWVIVVALSFLAGLTNQLLWLDLQTAVADVLNPLNSANHVNSSVLDEQLN